MIEQNCKTCGKSFMVRKSWVSYGHGKYCGKDCYFVYKKTLLGEKNKLWQGSFTTKCGFCENGIEIPKRNSDKRKSGIYFCSNICTNRFYGRKRTLPRSITPCIICGKNILDRTDLKRIVCYGKCNAIHKMVNRKIKMTSIEVKIDKQLKWMYRRTGVKYEKQKRFGNVTIPDFYIPSMNLIIYCDGDYWHSLPKAIEKDKRQNEFLRSKGYRVARFTETQINTINNKYLLGCAMTGRGYLIP